MTSDDDNSDDSDHPPDDRNGHDEGQPVGTNEREEIDTGDDYEEKDEDDEEDDAKGDDNGVLKSLEDQELIRLALHQNPYFTCMDEEQVNRFVQSAKLMIFQPGQAVILEGCRDERDNAENYENDNDDSNKKRENNKEISSSSSSGEIVEGVLADTDDLLDYETVSDGSVDTVKGRRYSDSIYSTRYLTRHRPMFSIDRVPPPSSGTKSYLYVIRNGNADVYYNTTNPASLGPGTLFGEGGFLFGRQHSASIVASSASTSTSASASTTLQNPTTLECWVVDYRTFFSKVLQSDILRQLFDTYAIQTDEEGNKFMSMDDFIRSCVRNEEEEETAVTATTTPTTTGGSISIANSYQSILRSYVHLNNNQEQNRIYLPDFCLFHLLMSRPDPEIDIAFLLMDRHRTGTITRADFEEYLSNVPYFDKQSEFVQRHFGQGQTIRSSDQFSQFLVDLQREMTRQAFFFRVKQLQKDNTNDDDNGQQQMGYHYVPSSDFVEILKTTSGWRLPDGIMNRLEELYCNKEDSKETSQSKKMVSSKNSSSSSSSSSSEGGIDRNDIEHHHDYQRKRLDTRYFSYIDLLAFQDVLGQLPNICNLIERTWDEKIMITTNHDDTSNNDNSTVISADELMIANRSINIGGGGGGGRGGGQFYLSRKQIDIIFQLFDLNQDGYISINDAVTVCGEEFFETITGRKYQSIQTAKATTTTRTRMTTTTANPTNARNANVGMNDTDNKQTSWMKRTAKYGSDNKNQQEQQQQEQQQHIVGQILTHTSQFLLSAIAGGMGVFVVYPLDLVKTRMMNQRTVKQQKMSSSTSTTTTATATISTTTTTTPQRLYRHSLDCLIKTYQYEGIFGLYRGILSPLLAVGPEKTIKFAANDLLRGLFQQEFYEDGNANGGGVFYWILEMFCGGCAGACQLLVTNPLEIIKIKMQLQGETTRLMTQQGFGIPKELSFTEIATNLSSSGLLYRGAAACLMRDIPFGAIFFPTYALCKDYLTKMSHQNNTHIDITNNKTTGNDPIASFFATTSSSTNILLAGTMAGIPASFLTTPFDVIKTRIQVTPRPGEVTYSGISDCIKSMYVNEGPTAFFKGSLFRVCRIAPQFGISLLGYELLSEFIGFRGPHTISPTNAPVQFGDYYRYKTIPPTSTTTTTSSTSSSSTFPANDIGTKTDNIDSLVRNMRLNGGSGGSDANGDGN